MGNKLSDLSNEDLLSQLHLVLGQEHVALARLLAYLGEVEERRLDLESACSSLYEFCVRRLGMSEDEAYRRVSAARLGRRFPRALEMIERRELQLTTLLLLRDHLTDENHEALFRASAGKTKKEVQEVIAAHFPRPDVPSLIQTLPVPAERASSPSLPRPEPTRTPARVEPLAPERYGVQFTASKELKEKIERATNLTRHQNPREDLARVVEEAVDLLLAKLEKQKLGKAKRPRASAPRDKTTRPGRVSRAVRRAVFERDGEQCTFVDASGRRCEARAFLELDHRRARALGGSDAIDNLCVKCRRHNALAAERDFGRAHVERKKAEKKETCQPRQRGERSETALRALESLGFKERDASRALDTLSERWDGPRAAGRDNPTGRTRRVDVRLGALR